MCVNDKYIEELKEYITDLEEECENLSEQNRTLTLKIQYLKSVVYNYENNEYPTCDVCGKRMGSGYHIEGTSEYYCSDECLYSQYTKEEYGELYNDGTAYWTEWD